MSNYERFEKYIEEHCDNCKHRKEELCDIRIFSDEKTVITKCVYYEKD